MTSAAMPLTLTPHSSANDQAAGPMTATSGCPYHRLRDAAAGVFGGAIRVAEGSREIPKAPGGFLLGNMTELLRDPLAFFIKGYTQLGPVFRVSAPTRSYVVMAGMGATRFLMREDGKLFDHKPLYKDVAEELGASHYPIATDGERHHHLRRTLRPALGAGRLGAAAPSIAASIGESTAKRAGMGGVVALDFLHEVLGDAVIPALTGRGLGKHLGDAVRFARFSVGCGLGAYPTAFRHWPGYKLSARRIRAFYGEVIAEHRNSTGRTPDFIDDVLAMTDEHGQPLSEENVFALAQIIYSNTLLYVAPTAAFLLHDLLSRPAQLQRCRAEIDVAFASGAPLLEALTESSYFVAAKTESMRLNPIGLAAPRVVKEAFTFDGCHLKRGETVLVATSAAHYDPQLYPEPHRFEPERHLSPRFESRRAGAYAPLGLGRHSCLAKRLVDAMVLVTVGALLHHTDLELPSADHVLRKRVNPFSEPTRDFVVRMRARA